MVIASEIKCNIGWLPCNCRILAGAVVPALLGLDLTSSSVFVSNMAAVCKRNVSQSGKESLHFLIVW